MVSSLSFKYIHAYSGSSSCLSYLYQRFGSCARVQFAIFADDVKIWKEIKNESDQFDLQNCLNAVVEWATSWQMTISVERCCVMKTGSSSSSKFEYDINGVSITYVYSVEDLEVEVDVDINFSTHCSPISKKASQRA